MLPPPPSEPPGANGVEPGVCTELRGGPLSGETIGGTLAMLRGLPRD